MNELMTMLFLAIVQGFTEWLPVSSSGHLVILQQFLNSDLGLIFDVALHFGTLMAVFVYFGKDITDILEATIKGKFKSPEGKMGILIIISAIPAVLAGYFLKSLFEAAFENIAIAALGLGITGLTLFIASFDYDIKRKSKSMNYIDAILIGIAQAIAIVPGISRSGSTLSTGLIRGIDRKMALKFSFLMSIPVIFGANIIVIGNNQLPTNYLWATLVAFIVGLLSIHLLFKIILNSKRNLRYFAVYTLLLALGLAIYIFTH